MPGHKAKVVFMGSPGFAVPALEALASSSDFEVIQVVTQPDRPKGRGKKISPTAVKQCAARRGLNVLEMSRANYAEVADALDALRPDFIVVAAFGVILKRDLLSMPRHGCVNLHASLLPRHRGVSPIQAALLAGDAETGCTTMLMDEGIDTGDMLMKVATPIEDADTAGSLEERLARLGAPLVIDTLAAIVAGSHRAEKQDETAATYAKKIRKRHGLIDWSRAAVHLWRQVRAMSPWPSAYTSYGGKRLIVVESAVARPVAGARPGEIATLSPLVVGAGEGALELIRVKVAGKRDMSAREFVAGYRVGVGGTLG